MDENPYESPLTTADSSPSAWRYWAAIIVRGLGVVGGVVTAGITMAAMSNQLRPYMFPAAVNIIVVGVASLIAMFATFYVGNLLAMQIWPPAKNEST
jgi:hypothetical protein